MTDFFKKLLDTREKSVDAVVFFTLIGVCAIVVYGLVQVCLDFKDFHISDFGSSFAFLFTGSGIHATGAGMQNKMTPPDGK